MKRSLQIGGCIFLVLTGGALWWRWKQDEPRRTSIETLERLYASLNSPPSASLLEFIVPPVAFQSRTPAEQIEFVQKALCDELSISGLRSLKEHGAFGPLKEIFPDEGPGWAAQAGVKAEACVGFRMEAHGLRAEVVLTKPLSIPDQSSGIASSYRIVRCNNVKQMAQEL